MAVKWKSTTLRLGSSFTRVLVPPLLDDGQLEFVDAISSSSDADENWHSEIILCTSSSEHSICIPEILSLMKAGKYKPSGFSMLYW